MCREEDGMRCSQHHGGATGRRVAMTVVQRGGGTGTTSQAMDAYVADIQFIFALTEPRRGARGGLAPGDAGVCVERLGARRYGAESVHWSRRGTLDKVLLFLNVFVVHRGGL